MVAGGLTVAGAKEAPAGGSDQERIARLEERVGLVHALVEEIRQDQKQMAEIVASASGGLRVLMLVGGLAGVLGLARGVSGLVGGWLAHAH